MFIKVISFWLVGMCDLMVLVHVTKSSDTIDPRKPGGFTPGG